MADFNLLGDLLLVTGTGSSSKAIASSQKAIYRKSISSHVALCLGENVYIHSTNENGVHLEPFDSIIKNCKDGWRVIRLNGIDASKRQLLLASANFFLSQSYNKKFMLPGNKFSSFCSELAAKSYIKAGLDVFNGLSPSKVTPAFFDKEADEETRWKDVTSEHKELLADIHANQLQYQLGFFMVSSSLNRLHRRNHYTDMLTQLALSILDSEESKESVKEIKKKIDDSTNFKYWDIDAHNKD